MKNSVRIFCSLLLVSVSFLSANAFNREAINTPQPKTIASVEKVASYIKKHGIEKAIIQFKNAKDILIGDYYGIFFISPLHPELIGKNQFNYQDPSGTYVVQEEINKAKAGGGWLKGRWRYNSLAGIYQCRKIYILPVAHHYFIGSWYHYSSKQEGMCFK